MPQLSLIHTQNCSYNDNLSFYDEQSYHIMRKLILLLSSIVTLTAMAGALDTRTKMSLGISANADTSATHPTRKKSDTADVNGNTLYYPMVIRFSDTEKGLAELAEIDAVIFRTRENMALACVPRNKIEVLDRGQFVDRASIGSPASTTSDVSRHHSGINTMHDGSAHPENAVFKGQGVVTGLCDMGFDPRHVAFRDRVGMMAIYVDSLAQRQVYAPGTSLHTGIDLPLTDNTDETHASHVANIMAGNIDGNPYYGAAPESTIAMIGSSLSDMALLCGIEDIIEFAREKNMPAVVNLSVGSYLGPHDGTDVVNQYLDMLGKEILICFSAGNNGHRQFNLQHGFTDTPGDVAGAMFESQRTWNGHNILGFTDVWSDNANGLEMQLVLWDMVERRAVYESPWFGSLDGSEGEYSVSSDNNAVWKQLMDKSYMNVYYGTDSYNGRYYMMLEYYIEPYADITPGGPHWGRYVGGWRVRGQSDTRFNAFTDGVISAFRAYGVPGMSDGNSLFSISNLCCNANTISVGSWNTRNTYTTDAGETVKLPFDTMRSTAFSSYGTLANGSTLPHICAPGNTIISAMSGPYAHNHPGDIQSFVVHTSRLNGNEYHWYAECGTSMASPLVAATMALWLQAYPGLDVTTARTLAQETATRNFADMDNPRWGAGAINASAGLQRILDAGIHNITDNNSEQPVYYSMQGTLSTHKPVQPGLYIEKTGEKLRKIIIR